MKISMIRLCLFFLVLPTFAQSKPEQVKSDNGWKAGVASANITPTESIWMSGFGFRNKPSEGIRTDVWASALAIEDESGRRAVFIAVDNSGIRKDLSDAIRKKLKALYNISNEQVVINSSHTHSGPAASERWGRDDLQKEKIRKYVEMLENRIIEITGEALGSLQPVKIYAGNGVTRFQVNRRTNIQYKLHLQSKFNGPNDYAVPVIKVEKASGDILAILFGYACHASMLRDYKISGDYPAFARIELKKLYPGATSLFFQGAGGNQIGHPRNSVEDAMQAGKTLAAAVERVLSEPMKSLAPTLLTSYAEVNLESDQIPPSKDALQAIASSSTATDSARNRAQADLEKLGKGESLVATYPYPVQVWKLGELPVVTLGGEPVIEYAIGLKQIFGQETFVFGYSNDVMSYISTPLILNEGGYEGYSSPFSSYQVKGVKWALNTEALIMEEAMKLAKKVGVEMAPKSYSIP